MPKFTYRNGRYFRDGKPYFAVASEYMYFRDRRDNWEDRLGKMKAAGINIVVAYFPWRHHMRVEDGKRSYDFTGKTKDSRDVVTFLKLVEAAGFLMILKPGPFIHSELNIGGLPDLVSPSFNPEIHPLRRHHGGPAYWAYDATQLPAPFEERYDDLAREWLAAVSELIRPYHREGGPLIGIQLVDETVYCTSNNPPWDIGYEPSGMRYYHKLLAERYGDLQTYNRLHGTDHTALAFAEAPRLVPLDAPGRRKTRIPKRREDVLMYIDWAELQWRYRRDLYERYKNYLGIDSTYLTNYAGITPPIEENVPDLKKEILEVIPADFRKLYSEWWFAMNRVDRDVDVHEYGFISWLGVAAYDRNVFDRYVNTARRARGINMEENWGFATLYDPRSKFPIVPFFQTLLSVAAGGTGYNVFVGVGSDYWDETLDRTTKLQCPTFPSDAPIGEKGQTNALYDTARMLNRWFGEHGGGLLGCEPEIDCTYLLYAPYAAISSWIPDEKYWGVEGHEIPRCGHRGVEEFSRSCQDAGYAVGFFELEAATPQRMKSSRSLAIHSAFFMDAAEQNKLAEFIAGGGRLFVSGELPGVDLKWEKCTVLKDAVEKAAAGKSPNVVYQRPSFFADGKFPQALLAAGIEPNVTCSPGMRAAVHRNEKGDEFFVFFFNFDEKGTHERTVEFYGRKMLLTLGSKTCGVLRVKGDRIVAHLVKGVNEVEGITDKVRIELGEQVIEGTGDFTSVG